MYMSNIMGPQAHIACDQLGTMGFDVGPIRLAVEGLDPDPNNRRSRSAQAIAERTIQAALDLAGTDEAVQAADMLRGAAAFCMYAAADEKLN